MVDASQGIEAQTLANVWLAVENDLEIIPVINKIDLPAADPERVKKEIEDLLGIDASDALLCSAKTGTLLQSLWSTGKYGCMACHVSTLMLLPRSH